MIMYVIGKPAFTFTFKRKDKARTLATIAPNRTINSCLLFEGSW